ncbi:response regulator transcription factor [Anatilimnocola floriformis]|uniref:response regulator transcription factor n=1 Tax=Anatilimnocola floriformis TaxID=2948575 RepID=UPI0020C1E602|nr:response regulator transcription factor [Anatilimnocola floriformis]
MTTSTTASEPSTWRVLIVDDHQLFRNGLRELLSAEPDLEVCGEAADVATGLASFQSLRPNLVTIDISLSKENGLHLVEQIRVIEPKTAILVLSMYDAAVYANRALAAGAAGYVCKQSTNQEILEALRMAKRSREYPANRKSSVVESQNEESQLSARELEIFTLIGQGDNTQKIAQKLELSPSTIETYRERIKAKLNLANGSELTHRAILWFMQHS